MNKLDHISNELLIALAAGELSREEADAVREHVVECPACSSKLASLSAFTQSLDAAWNANRLSALGMAHPTESEIETVWIGEADKELTRSVKEHVACCEACAGHLARLEEGFTTLDAVDPLGVQPWSATVSQKFTAGIEMIVEAANGAYTSAAGLVREVMTPQATSRLSATPTLAMKHSATETRESWLWHDATFLTDEMSGKVNGSSDRLTGRGTIHVVIHKSGAFVGAQPIIDLVNASGTTVSTQGALDVGDSFTVNFTNLDEGRYLVGIRKSGG